MKKRAVVFILILLLPFVLFAQETAGEEDFAEPDNLVSAEEENSEPDNIVSVEEENSEPEHIVLGENEEDVDAGLTEREGREIANQVEDVITAQPGDYILLPSGNKYILTKEEIMIVSGAFDYDSISDIATETDDDGTEIKTISPAHEIRIYPDGQSVHILKTNIAYLSFLKHIEEKYHLMRYLDSSIILHDRKSLEAPDFNVFRVFIQFETISNGFEELDSVAVSVYNYEGKSYAIKYSSAPGMVWGVVSSEEQFKTTVRAIPVVRQISELQVSATELPSAMLREIANRTIKVGETISLQNLTVGRNVTSWISSTPSAVSVDASGNVTGLSIGNAYITFNETEYIAISVVPQVNFYTVPESQSALLPPASRVRESSTLHLNEYRTEPTFRLSWRFNNKGENKGASGPNGGIDILGRGANYEWLWTTYFQGGWFYNLNDVMREMVNGYQRGSNGVALTVQPEFVYEEGIPYLQLRHFLHNTNNFAVTGQRFGASADVMIHNNDFASLILTPYGAYMTDSQSNPSLELMFICLSGNGITPVDTLWLGTYPEGHLRYIYSDRRYDIHNADSALGFSYQNINLAPGEIKEFIVRFTLARVKEQER
ncbi:MAG: Ig-like domain-containing protein [Treponema sp.]|nr:Ig-like domain-containing protein [Treponema sp.]